MVSASRDDSAKLFRANRAQFSDVSLRHIDEDEDVPEEGMPTVRGDDDMAGMSIHLRIVIYS